MINIQIESGLMSVFGQAKMCVKEDMLHLLVNFQYRILFSGSCVQRKVYKYIVDWYCTWRKSTGLSLDEGIICAVERWIICKLMCVMLSDIQMHGAWGSAVQIQNSADQIVPSFLVVHV